MNRAAWAQRAAALRFPDRPLIDGVAVAGEEAPIAAINPATGALLAEVGACSAADIDRAVSAARSWPADLGRAHRVARRLQAGLVWVNCYFDGDITVPFGGVKQSGFGRDKSLHALDKYSALKSTWIRLPAAP